MIGNDVFLKGIRQGIELGEYVYQSGDLLWGKGDPWATIKIDEQSLVFTASYARENSIWPPRKEPPPAKPPGAVETADSGPAGSMDAPGSVADQEGAKPADAEAVTAAKGRAGANTITAEGVLKESLTRLWEQARARKFAAVISMTLKIYDPADGFKLLGLVGAIPRATKQVAIEGSYATPEGGELHLEFKGNVSDAQPVKDFLDPQLRAASEKEISIVFSLQFAEGLPLTGDEPEKLTERLTRFGTGAVYVTAVAEGGA